MDAFIAKYSPGIAADLRAAREHVSAFFPRGYELVYDNYNALVFGFSPTERASDAIASVAGYPNWVTLFFLKGRGLPDPERLLQGTGTKVRSVRLQPLSVLFRPAVQTLLAAAVAEYSSEFEGAPRLSTVVKSVSARQRSRRPPDAGRTRERAVPTRPTRR